MLKTIKDHDDKIDKKISDIQNLYVFLIGFILVIPICIICISFNLSDGMPLNGDVVIASLVACVSMICLPIVIFLIYRDSKYVWRTSLTYTLQNTLGSHSISITKDTIIVSSNSPYPEVEIKRMVEKVRNELWQHYIFLNKKDIEIIKERYFH